MMMRAFTLMAIFAAAPAAADFGAIAFAPSNGAYGYAYDYGTRAEAEREALNGCFTRARDCRIVSWFQNACGVLVTSPGNGWGAAWGNSLGHAESNALSECYNAGNSTCTTVIGMCSLN